MSQGLCIRRLEADEPAFGWAVRDRFESNAEHILLMAREL